jgi:Transposase DDE domain group 1
MAEPLLKEAQREAQEAAQTKAKVRLIGEGSYQADSWDHTRRVIYKAEVLEKGTNTRFVLTSKNDESRASSTIGTLSAGRSRDG